MEEEEEDLFLTNYSPTCPLCQAPIYACCDFDSTPTDRATAWLPHVRVFAPRAAIPPCPDSLAEYGGQRRWWGNHLLERVPTDDGECVVDATGKWWLSRRWCAVTEMKEMEMEGLRFHWRVCGVDGKEVEEYVRVGLSDEGSEVLRVVHETCFDFMLERLARRAVEDGDGEMEVGTGTCAIESVLEGLEEWGAGPVAEGGDVVPEIEESWGWYRLPDEEGWKFTDYFSIQPRHLSQTESSLEALSRLTLPTEGDEPDRTPPTLAAPAHWTALLAPPTPWLLRWTLSPLSVAFLSKPLDWPTLSRALYIAFDGRVENTRIHEALERAPTLRNRVRIYRRIRGLVDGIWEREVARRRQGIGLESRRTLGDGRCLVETGMTQSAGSISRSLWEN